MAQPLLSVVIPAFNEEARLGATLEQVVAYLDSRPYAWEVVVADDGSTDGTTALALRLAEREPRVHLASGAHGGKGLALRRGMSAAQGKYLFLCDADLSMPIQHLSRFLPPSLDEYDLAIGSREVPGARRFGEPRLRHLQGRVFNWLVRLLAVPGYADTQCGFKCLDAQAAHRILPLLRIRGFSFDVELLFLARKQGMRITEVPIDWRYHGRSRVRVLVDAVRMLGEVLLIRWNHLLGRYRAPMPGRQGAGAAEGEPLPSSPEETGRNAVENAAHETG